MNKDTYIIVHSFMNNSLGLTGIELLTYATIYGFSKDNQGLFRGSASYIGGIFGASRESITRVLSKLVSKGYIIKEEKFCEVGKVCTYRINSAILNNCEDTQETKPHDIDKPKTINWETVYTNNDNKYDDTINKFNELWELYGKVGSRKNAFKCWYKLTDEQKDKAYDNVPDYFASLSDLKYRKHMERYISQELYLQEFTPVKKEQPKFNNFVTQQPTKKRNKLN